MMRFARVAALAVVPSLALFSTTAYAADSCWYPNEAKAAQLRDFQTMLMVGTLQCRSSNKFAVERYNEFVTRQRGLLDANAYVLKTHFLRENGIQQGQGAYDGYATQIANMQSAKAADPGFCASVDTFVRMGTDATQADLLVLAQSVSEAPASGPCPPSNYMAAKSDSGADQADAAAAVTVATPETKAAVVEPGAASDAPAAAATPAVVETAAEVPAPAKAVTPPAPSRDEALRAAIAALQSATAALQAATAPAAPAAAADATPTKKAKADVIKIADAPVVPPKDTPAP
jgi:hypothetical protein